MVSHPTDYQLHLFHEGSLFQSHELFGAHIEKNNSGANTRFCVWAPKARNVRIVGDFNSWNADGYDFKKINDEGVWSLIVEGDLTNALYKYELVTPAGDKILKADPFAFYSEVRPNTASIVYPLEGYKWNDTQWLRKKRKESNKITTNCHL